MQDEGDNFDFDALCEKILAIDDKIRSARVLGNKGRLIGGGMRKGLKALQEPKKDEMLFTELALIARMRHEYDEEFGSVEFTLSYRDKVALLTFLIDENVLFVSTEREIDLNKIPFKILELIKKTI